jgi:hypothetical protein
MPAGVECCGERHLSPHCGQCGARLAHPHPLWRLVAHCRAVARSHRTRAEKLRRQDRPAAVGRAEGEAARWEGYAEGLAALLPREGGVPS